MKCQSATIPSTFVAIAQSPSTKLVASTYFGGMGFASQTKHAATMAVLAILFVLSCIISFVF